MKLIDLMKEKVVFKILFWIARVGMGATFIMSGIRKLPGIKFTELPEENPVGYFFMAMHETGFYWNVIGLIQVLIGTLIFLNRFVVLSSLLMMPITINIFLISISLNMTGTPIITGAMLVGNLFLLLWYFNNYKNVFAKPIS